MGGQPGKRIPVWLVVLSAVVIPGSGHVWLGKPMRGMLMLLWIFVFAFLTFQLTTDNISPVGRLAGGFAVWTLSVLEVYRLAKRQ